MNIIELSDFKITPDIVHEYQPALKTDQIPLVIDNGSYKCRVGWSNCEAPLLEFRNLIAKPRKDRKKDTVETVMPPIQIGNDIVNIEAMRLQLKTQFDRNVVTHFHNQEQIFDYIFSHLGIDHDGAVPHPILLTEALANPSYCRSQMNELLFECYDVPALNYGVDSLFSWQRNCLCDKTTQDALILSFGFHTTHVIPMLNGRLQADRVRRINVGGYHIITYLFRLMQMKYPVHLNAITVSRMETLIQQHGSIALNYLDDLRQWAESDFYAQNVKIIQLPYIAPQLTVPLTAEQKTEKRKELARRLMATNERRAKEKQLEDEQQLQLLSEIRQLHENGEQEEFQLALQEQKLSSLQSLDKILATVRSRIERTRQKLEEPPTDFSGPREKRIKIAKPPPEISLQNWICDVKDKRGVILKRKQDRKSRRQEMAKRHTVAAQERMRIISQLARNEKGTDEFGMEDKDWDVYKVINRDNDSDSDAENEKLLEYEKILRHYDESHVEESTPPAPAATAEHYQLHVGVECIRAPELLFQPSMLGNPEMGLGELIAFVLKLFTPSEQLRLANNVFMTGGCAQFPGLKARLSRELLEMRPFQTPHCIKIAQAPELDAWLGARDFANGSDFADYLTTKKDYEEQGAEYLRAQHGTHFTKPG